MTTENSPRWVAGGRNASFDTDHTKFAQQVSAVTPLGDAIDGTAKPRPRRAGKRRTSIPVKTTHACGCGYQTDDIETFVVHLLAELAEVRAGQERRADGRRLTAACGTLPGYARHRRRGEPACVACKAANAEYSASRRQLPGALEERRAYMAIPENRERHRARERARYAARKQRESGA